MIIHYPGVGLNIANSKPTVCINDMLPPGATKLNIEETLALILNKFEGKQTQSKIFDLSIKVL
jgi:hypothetical protein